MSSIDLIILGMLKKEPMSAYDLKLHMERVRLSKWMKIAAPTIFQNLKKLAAKGLLASEIVRQGEMPEKTVYSLAPAGEEHFRALMGQFACDPGSIHFAFNAFVKNIELLDQDEALELVQCLKAFLAAMAEDLDRDAQMAVSRGAPLGMRAILEQYRMVLGTLAEWADWLDQECRNRAWDCLPPG